MKVKNGKKKVLNKISKTNLKELLKALEYYYSRKYAQGENGANENNKFITIIKWIYTINEYKI